MERKIGGCVVLYNPDENVYDHVLSYIDILECLVIIDNSEEKSAIIKKLLMIEKVVYLNNGGNKGIAYALNRGVSYLYKNGYEVALTMDQDSIFPKGDSDSIIALVDKYIDSYAIVGLNFNENRAEKTDRIVEPKYWLTSGNFLRIQDWKAVRGFSNKLFIDYVDIEFDYKLNRIGQKICYMQDYSLKHSIGSPIEIKLPWKKYYSMNHSPVRYYYRYRNSRYLMKIYKGDFCKMFLKEILVNLPKMILFEKDKRAKIRMIHKGVKDGKNGVLGPL